MEAISKETDLKQKEEKRLCHFMAGGTNWLDIDSKCDDEWEIAGEL